MVLQALTNSNKDRLHIKSEMDRNKRLQKLKNKAKTKTNSKLSQVRLILRSINLTNKTVLKY